MDNPSIQCSICGQWKRQWRKTGEDAGSQTFYPVCDDFTEHENPVCHVCCQSGKCPNKVDPFKGVVKIQFEWWAGKGHGIRNRNGTFWTAILDGETLDYLPKQNLIESIKSKGFKYAVLRHHKKGGRITIMEKNY